MGRTGTKTKPILADGMTHRDSNGRFTKGRRGIASCDKCLCLYNYILIDRGDGKPERPPKHGEICTKCGKPYLGGDNQKTVILDDADFEEADKRRRRNITPAEGTDDSGLSRLEEIRKRRTAGKGRQEDTED